MDYNEICDVIEKINSDYLELRESNAYKSGLFINRLLKGSNNEKVKIIKDRIRYMLIKNKLNKYSLKDHNPLFYCKGDITNWNKAVVYTCITGDYDNVPDVKFVEENVDYFILSDQKPRKLQFPWVWKEIPKEIRELGKIEANRYFKFNPFYLGSNYDFSMYIDGNVDVVSNITNLFSIAKKSKIGIAMHMHSSRDCVYDEANVCILYRRGNKRKIMQQIQDYRKVGFPEHFGLYEATVIVTDLNSCISKKIMTAWWNEFLRTGSMRDQLSFPFVVWKNKYCMDDAGVLGNDMRKNPKFRVLKHGSKA